MNILAIDTALQDVSVAVWGESGAIVDESFRHERDALQRLTGLIQKVLACVQLAPEDIDVVACTRGPGSFTGLRVGIAAAKAFADAVGAKMAGASTLYLLARRAPVDHDGVVVSLIEACPGELYTGAYREGVDGRLICMDQDTVRTADTLGSWLRELRTSAGGRPPLVVGPAIDKYASSLEDCSLFGDIHGIAIRDLITVADIANRDGLCVAPLEFQPEYLRLSQAEVRAAAR